MLVLLVAFFRCHMFLGTLRKLDVVLWLANGGMKESDFQRAFSAWLRSEWREGAAAFELKLVRCHVSSRRGRYRGGETYEAGEVVGALPYVAVAEHQVMGLLRAAYGGKPSDWSYIPGGVISGTALIRPDLPELKIWPYFWQQTEYVMGGGEANYMFLALAVDQLNSAPK